MFTIRFVTDLHRPDENVTLRSARGAWVDQPGLFDDDAWVFGIEDDAPGLFAFKFVLDGTWMDGPDLAVPAAPGAAFDFDDARVTFSPAPAVWTENTRVAQLYLRPDLDEHQHYEVVVVGSGMGGGLLADQLADAGADVLLLEVGSYLFPTHVANLPRRLRIGRFDKSVWGLYRDFAVRNYVNVDGSSFAGAQAFNLGGRTLFWGGLIPRMGAWELVDWPAPVREYLLSTGYRLAEDALNRSGPLGSLYQEQAKKKLSELLPDFDHLDAPVAVQYEGYTPLAIPDGMFSTADLLLEDRLVDDPGRKIPTINLNTAVQAVEVQGGRATGVRCYDLLGRRARRFSADTVVLCAGTIESAKIALQSGLDDPSGLIGRGITDHPIWYTHFSLPAGSPFAVPRSSAKVLSRHRQVSADSHPYNVVVELGADFNQGRYVDEDNLAAHRAEKGDSLLCEIVFLFNAPLVAEHRMQLAGDPSEPVRVVVNPAPLAAGVLDEARQVAATVLGGLGAEAIVNETLDLAQAALGGVAHEVGTLRMGEPGSAVVDSDLRFFGCENLYACDNSVFASSPAANPTLTLAALALRLARHLTAP